MPVKPVISIEVDDTAFKRFYALFEQYQAEVEKQPEAWKALGEAMGDSAKGLAGGATTAKESFAIAAAQAGIISEALSGAVKAQKDLGSATERSAGSMGKLHKNALGIGSAIAGIGGWIIKLGAFGGLGGLLSGLGIGELASASFTRSRSAGRLGMSTGALASFGVNVQRFLGTDALQSAVMAQNTVGGLGALSMLGIGPERAQRMDPGDLAIEELRAATKIYLHDKASGMKVPFSDPRLKNIYHGMLGGDLQSVLLAAQPGGLAELDKRQRGYHQNIGAFNISAKDQEELNNFKIALDRAGMSIETTFIHGLAPLAPELDNLSVQFTGFIKDVLASQAAKDSINLLAGGLHSLGVTLASDSFRHDLKRFGQDISWIVDKLKLIPIVNDKGGAILNTANAASQGAGAAAHQAIIGPLDWAGDILKVPQRTAWSISLLNKLHDPLTPANIAFMNKWQKQEGTSAGYNPLATTQAMPGATNFNDIHGADGRIYHVRNYRSAQQGYDATIQTLKYYKGILAGLASGNPFGKKDITSDLQEWGSLAKAGPGSKWYDEESSHWYTGKADIAKAIINNVLNTVDTDIKKYGKSWASHLPKDVAAFVASAHLSPMPNRARSASKPCCRRRCG